MLALSLPGSSDEPRDRGLWATTAPPLTWRRWLEMLWPDTPSRHRATLEEWHPTGKTSSDRTPESANGIVAHQLSAAPRPPRLR
jgi:hypothetical protein